MIVYSSERTNVSSPVLSIADHGKERFVQISLRNTAIAPLFHNILC